MSVVCLRTIILFHLVDYSTFMHYLHLQIFRVDGLWKCHHQPRYLTEEKRLNEVISSFGITLKALRDQCIKWACLY